MATVITPCWKLVDSEGGINGDPGPDAVGLKRRTPPFATTIV